MRPTRAARWRSRIGSAHRRGQRGAEMATPKENFSLQDLREAAERDPEEVLSRLRSGEGKLLSLEDPAGFQELRRSAGAAAVELRLKRSAPRLSTRDRYAFALGCAERVLPLVEARHPQEKWARELLEIIRAGVEGKVRLSQLSALCGDYTETVTGGRYSYPLYEDDTSRGVVGVVTSTFSHRADGEDWPESVSERVALLMAQHAAQPDQKPGDVYAAARREHLAIARALIGEALTKHEA